MDKSGLTVGELINILTKEQDDIGVPSDQDISQKQVRFASSTAVDLQLLSVYYDEHHDVIWVDVG